MVPQGFKIETFKCSFLLLLRMAEKSVFLKVEGDNPKNRIWDFLIVHSEFDYSMKEIAKYSNVSYTTLKRLWKDFRKKKIVIETRMIGKAKMYKLNLGNPVVGKFTDFFWEVIDNELGIKEKNKVKNEHISSDPVGVGSISARNV